MKNRIRLYLMDASILASMLYAAPAAYAQSDKKKTTISKPASLATRSKPSAVFRVAK
jgi:hypothetical protein